MSSRECSRCKRVLGQEDFTPTRWERGGRCRDCDNEYLRKYRQEKPWRMWRYGIDNEQFERMLEAQDGRCAICLTGEWGAKGPNVDHDHSCCNHRSKSCGKCVRALICWRCNMGLGYFRDNAEYLRLAADYLESHSERGGDVAA